MKLKLSAKMKKAYMEHFHYIKTLGFSGHTEKFYFNSERYKKLLEVAGDKYNYNFKLSIELTKKEMENIKAFLILPNSALATKYYVNYPSYEKIPSQKICFKNKQICMFKEHNIKGMPTIKNNFFKTFEVWYTVIIVTDFIKSEIKESNLSGIEFGKIINIDKQEDLYLSCLYSKNIMENKCLETCFYDKKEHNFLVYESGVLDSINDFNYTSEPFKYDQSGIIVSQKFKNFYDKKNLKGFFFYPIFEKDSMLFDKLNSMLTEFAIQISSTNSHHTIGNNEINPSKFINGIL